MVFPEKGGNATLALACPDGHQSITISGINSVMINVYPDGELRFNRLPNIKSADFLKSIPEGSYGDRYALARKTVPPFSFIKTLGPNKEFIQIVVKPPLGIEKYDKRNLCLSNEVVVASSYLGYICQIQYA